MPAKRQQKELSTSERFDTLARVGIAILSEYDESRLLKTIAQAACDITGARYAAFTLRPVDDSGRPLGPADGSNFRVATIVGVSKQEEALLRRYHLGNKGFLAPIFRNGVPVRVADITSYRPGEKTPYTSSFLEQYPEDFEAAYGPIPSTIEFGGFPVAHPLIRSFLGAPLLSREKEVVGGLILGDPRPNTFDSEDEALLVGLAAQSIIALENARFYRVIQSNKALLKSYENGLTRRDVMRILLDEIPSPLFIVHGPEAKLSFANRSMANFWNTPWSIGQPLLDFFQQNSIRAADERGRELRWEDFPIYRALMKNETVRYFQAVLTFADTVSMPIFVSAIPLNKSEMKENCLQEIFGTSISEPAAMVIHQNVKAFKDQERMKDEFIGIAAHELKTPLAILRGFAQTLCVQTDRGYGSSLEDWQIESIEGIEQATNRLTELTEDLLDVTRLQSGRLSLHVEPCDLVAITQRVIQRLQIVTHKHQIILHTDFDYLVVQADSYRLEQVLNNLVTNAIKYSPNGGDVNVTIGEVPGESVERYALVSIQDSGIGIPENQQAHVFRRFMRADNARQITGTGLGLYLCRSLVEQQGGKIWLQSVENEGTTFYFTLPLYVEQ